jgi:hypothetical protein
LSPFVSIFPLELIFCDVWGPSPALPHNKNHYYVSFVDDYSKFIWVFPIQRKSDMLTVFQKFQNHVERMFFCKLISIQTDGEGEFLSLIPYFSTNGILHKLACPYSHQQQGTVERQHRHIVETALTLLVASFVPHSYWDEAFVTTTFLVARLPTKILDNTSPFEKLFLRSPDYNILRVLDVPTGLIFDPTTNIRWSSDPRCVSSLDTASNIVDINVYTYLLVVSM